MNTIAPFTQKWHKRSLKIVEQLQNARNIYSRAWNYTQELISNLDIEIKNSSLKLIKIEELLRDDISNYQNIIIVSLEVENFYIDEIIMYIILFEMFCLMTFAMIIRNPSMSSQILHFQPHKKKKSKKSKRKKKQVQQLQNAF